MSKKENLSTTSTGSEKGTVTPEWSYDHSSSWGNIYRHYTYTRYNVTGAFKEYLKYFGLTLWSESEYERRTEGYCLGEGIGFATGKSGRTLYPSNTSKYLSWKLVKPGQEFEEGIEVPEFFRECLK